MFEIELTSAESTAGPPKSETAWLKERRKSWARLIRLVYEANPLLCRCGQRMAGSFALVIGILLLLQM